MEKKKESLFKSFKFKIFLMAVLTIITSSTLTFGFFFAGKSQSGTSGMNTLTCFDMSFTDANSITLEKAMPISDEAGKASKPYTFTIKSNCPDASNYYVILNVKAGSFEERFLNLTLDDGSIKRISSFSLNSKFDKPEGYDRSYIISKDTLEGQKELTHKVRIWMDKDTTYDDVKGKSWEGQIKVVSVVKELDDITSTKTLVETLLAKTNNASITDYNSGVKGEMYTFSHSATAQTEALTDYRYIGNEPNNYIQFNNETWRIIGVFTVEGENGEKEQRVKIIRDESIGSIKWDSNNINEWPASSLSTLLNTGDYYNRSGTYETTGLTDTAKSQISPAKWYLGGNSTLEVDGPSYYAFERGETTYATSHSGETRSTNTIKNVGLMYPSDYVYTYANGVDNICYSNGYNCNSGTPSSGWLFNSSIDQWTITPFSSVSTGAFYVNSFGCVRSSIVNYSAGVHPSAYLRSDIEIASGTGAENDPYILKS